MKNKNTTIILAGGLMVVAGFIGIVLSCLSNMILSNIMAAIPRDITLGAPILKFGSAINLLMEGGSFSFNHAWAWEVLLVLSSLLAYIGTMMVLGGFRDDVNVKDVLSLRYWTFMSVIKTRKPRKPKAKKVSKLLKKQ